MRVLGKVAVGPVADGSPAESVEDRSDRHPKDRLRRELSCGDSTMLVVSSVIGVGIFLTPGSIAELLPHPGVFLATWLVVGLLCLAGALANAELGAMYPYAGGAYVYLREACHPFTGFSVGWLSFLVIYVGTVATLALGVAEGMTFFVAVGEAGRDAIALVTKVLASWVNYLGVRRGARLNNVTAVANIGGLLAIVLAGLLIGRGDAAHFTPVVRGASELPMTAFGLGLSPVLFSYLGWNASVHVASEIREPEHNVPRSLFTGLLLCNLIYILVNILIKTRSMRCGARDRIVCDHTWPGGIPPYPASICRPTEPSSWPC